MKLKDLKPGMYLKTSHGDVVKIDYITDDRITVSNSDHYAWYCTYTGQIIDLKGHRHEEHLVEVLTPQKLEIEDED